MKTILPAKINLSFREVPDSLEFKRTPKRRATRIAANAAVRFLKRIGWLRPETIKFESIQTLSIDLTRFDNWLLKEHYDIMSKFSVSALILVIGSKQMYDLTRQMVSQPFRFEVQSFGEPTRFAGMLVCVLPWIDGVALVPKPYWPIDEKIIEVPTPMFPEDCKNDKDRRKCEAATRAWQKEMVYYVDEQD